MRRLREILRDEYIGAIAIGFLLAQAIGGVIGVILQPLITYFQNRGRRPSIFASQTNFNWPELILGVISIILHLLAALLLLYWLYLKKSPEPVIAPEAPPPDDDPEGPHE
ncbi:MAG TPA: hypothetical protein VJA94_18130 [Candidatus Angelobacter sp.]